MERIKVTEAQVRTALVEAVADKGDDYVYANPDGEGGADGAMCYYVHGVGENAVPGCIVGNALHRLGVPLDVLAENEERGAYVVAGELIEVTEGSGEKAFTWLAQAQDSQDNGAMWGDALAYAGVVTRVGDDA